MEDKKIIETSESNFKKNIYFIGIALICLIVNYKISIIPITKVAACILLFIAGNYFNKNYNNKHIFYAAIFVAIIIAVEVLKTLINPMTFIGKFDEIIDMISQYGGNPDQYELLNSVLNVIKKIKTPIIIDTFISCLITVLSIFSYYFIGKCMVKLSNSEEACEKISKASKLILIFGAITAILVVIEVITTMGLIDNINISSTALEGSFSIGNNSGILSSIGLILIVSLALCVCSIIYLVNEITIVVQVFKTAKAGKDNNPLIEQTPTQSNNEEI